MFKLLQKANPNLLVNYYLLSVKEYVTVLFFYWVCLGIILFKFAPVAP